jgi:hypothetical protein
MANFQKSNWTRSVESDGMVVYAPGGIPNVAVNANTSTTITITIPFKFKGNAMMEVTLPTSATPLVAGLSLSECNLIAPAAGSYAAGNHPRASFKISNNTAGGLTPPATDVIIWQT